MLCNIAILDSTLLGNTIVAIATIFATTLGVYLVKFVNKKIDERRNSFEEEERILKSLEYLTGGTQLRSAGLGIIEGLLLPNKKTSEQLQYSTKNYEKLRNVFLPVVRNQLIYLSTSSNRSMAIHEHDNFIRLLHIWNQLEPGHDEIEQLRIALDAHVDQTRGLEFVGGYRNFFDDLKISLGQSAEDTKR